MRNTLTIDMRPAVNSVVSRVDAVRAAGRALTAALEPFEGNVKSVFMTYLALDMNRAAREPGGVKSFGGMTRDMGRLAGRDTIRRWTLELDPELAATIAAAHTPVAKCV